MTLFTVIPLLWLISGQAWEAHFDAIYGDPVLVADLRTSLGAHFDAIYGDPALVADLRTTLGGTFPQTDFSVGILAACLRFGWNSCGGPW